MRVPPVPTPALALALALVVAACAGPAAGPVSTPPAAATAGASPPVPPSPSPSPAAAPVGDDPPAWVTGRAPLRSCGTETADHAGGWDNDARRCLVAAWQAGDPAELASTALTLEGETVTHVYRVPGPGELEVYVDETLSPLFGAGRWLSFRCPTLVGRAASDASLSPGLEVELEVDDCVER